MGIFGSQESYTHDIEINYLDIVTIGINYIAFKKDSYVRVLTFVDDKFVKFYELTKDGFEKRRNIFLKCHKDIIYGVSDNNINGTWYMSDRLSPTSYGYVLSDH